MGEAERRRGREAEQREEERMQGGTREQPRQERSPSWSVVLTMSGQAGGARYDEGVSLTQ